MWTFRTRTGRRGRRTPPSRCRARRLPARAARCWDRAWLRPGTGSRGPSLVAVPQSTRTMRRAQIHSVGVAQSRRRGMLEGGRRRERGRLVCCEHLVCASCAHAVVDARCAVCRSARDRLHRHSTTQPYSVLLLLAAILALAVVLSTHLAG